jgi:hypothetical protein
MFIHSGVFRVRQISGRAAALPEIEKMKIFSNGTPYAKKIFPFSPNFFNPNGPSLRFFTKNVQYFPFFQQKS